jgi:aspartate aminotransferase-like enzyme/GNAT superfamily N-acetyltransferase
MDRYRIKLAESARERDSIHALNYATFVEEIPQHAPNGERRLVDRFDPENEYVIAIDGKDSIIGMLALRAQRPFSLDQKLHDLDDHLPPHRSACEVRLLAVRRSHRHQRIFRDLVAFAARRCIAAGHDLAVISGTTRQLGLYAHIGFEPFGPLVGTESARYQPMVLSLESFVARLGDMVDIAPGDACLDTLASFLPGPVTPAAHVRSVFGSQPISHRTPAFTAMVGRARDRLCELTGAAEAALLLGSGTLANDVVAASIANLEGRGLVLANGEFGERLVDHARRAGLRFEVLRRPWGRPFDGGEVREALLRGDAGWLWAVHCETSTGVLNDLEMLREAATASGAELHLDCVSSVGTVPVSLSGVRLASCASGKGLGAYPGLSMVLLDSHPVRAAGTAPRYLDLALWLDRSSVPFTHSSNLVAALDAALACNDWPGRMQRVARHAAWLRRELRARGLRVVASEPSASPGVTTIELPDLASSADVALVLQRGGVEISWRSAYLVQRNWIQIALMGEYDPGALRKLPVAIAHAAGARTQTEVRAA